MFQCDFFLNSPLIPGIGRGDKPFELGIPFLVFYNPPKRLGCISKAGDFRGDRARPQKRLETAILENSENL